MSVSSSIRFMVVNRKTGAPFSQTKIIEALINNGWSLICQSGYVSYLPLHDNDNFNWVDSKISVSQLMEILKTKEQNKELIGIHLVWQEDPEIEGDLLLYSQKEMKQKGIVCNASFGPSIRKILTDYGHFKITDVNWYLERLLPIFNHDDMHVEYFEYTEHA